MFGLSAQLKISLTALSVDQTHSVSGTGRKVSELHFFRTEGFPDQASIIVEKVCAVFVAASQELPDERYRNIKQM